MQIKFILNKEFVKFINLIKNTIYEMEKCLVCKSINCLSIINQKLMINKCKICKAIFLEKEYQQLKDEPYVKVSKIKELYLKQIQKPIEVKIINYYMNYLKKNTNMNFRSVLDIGAGYGYLIKKFGEMKVSGDGIESNGFKNKFAVTKNIKIGYFDENFKLKKKYDLICFTQVLNYLRNTKQILDNVKKFLNDEGLIFIVTTNPESKYVIEDYSNASEESYYSNMLYSKKNFEELEDIGLKLLDYTTYREDIAIDFIRGNKVTTFLKYRMNLKKPIVEDPEGNIAMILLKKIEKS